MTTLTAESLLQPLSMDREVSVENVHDILNELYDEWVPGAVQDARNLHIWAAQRFGTNLDDITSQTLKEGVDRRVKQFKQLYTLVKNKPALCDDGIVRERVERIAKVIREARNSVQAVAILYFQMDDGRQLSMPDSWNPDSFFQMDDDKTTTFQRLLLHVLKKLAADELRRLDDQCYKEIIVEESGERSHAWAPLKSIHGYIYDNIQKETDYEEWKCLTNPHDNGDKVVQHLINSSQIEFPALNMNRYLWAYNNGLYNVLEDMFWPFRAAKLKNLSDVTNAAVQALPAHEMTGDDMELDIDCAHHIVDGVAVWNVHADGRLSADTCFKVGDIFYSNMLGRESWPALARDIVAFRRGIVVDHVDALTAELAQTGQETEQVMNEASATVCHGVLVWNAKRSGQLTRDTFFGVNGRIFANKLPDCFPVWTTPLDEEYNVCVPTAADVAVKHFDRDFRFDINSETEKTFDASTIELPEMETIMNVQKLDSDSQDWLVLMLCRLFFPTGYDRWQVVLFIKGIAGSGKSTLAQIMRSFYPPTRITTLSSNIEAKFGLSAIYKGMLCICAEVREDFGLDQAEWQSCVSGEEVQIAVKQKTAFPWKWTTPFFFLGNELPSYKNASGSVDRRIFMIEFRQKVLSSDPKLLDKFFKNIDLFQRKGVSLYHAALRKHGHRDIWAPGVVGKQIEMWRNEMKTSTDILYAFLTSDKFEFGPQKYFPLDEFKTQHQQYRRENGFPNITWKKDYYHATFQDLTIHIESGTEKYPPIIGETKTQQYIYGLDIRSDVGDAVQPLALGN